MASTPPPPPPPHCSSFTARPSNSSNNQNHRHQNHPNNNNRRNHHHHLRRQENTRRYSYYANNSPLPLGNGIGSGSGAAVGGAVVGSAAGTAAAAFSSSLGYLGGRKSGLGSEFSGRRSTRFSAKMHSGRLRIHPNNKRHSPVADEALHCLMKAGNDAALIDNVLLSFEPRIRSGDDYIFLIKEFGNRDQFLLVTRTYDFAMGKREYGWDIKGKLTSSMISTLGKMKKLEQAWKLFEMARNQGFGNTVYSFSSMISAFGHNGRWHDAVRLFRSMRNLGIEPNVVTYNSLIDAGAKGHVEFSTVVKYFDEMIENGFMPDGVTYNSLLGVCVPGGAWEIAQDLFAEMRRKGHKQDVYTYNTYLDALCKGGQLDYARRVLAEMPANGVYPSVVTYSTMIDGYAKAGRCEEALVLYDEMKRLEIPFDRVSYNTLIGVYGRLGWFDEVLKTCREMEVCGFTKDIVTYNALLGGYGKHGMYDEVRRIFDEMQGKRIHPNTLTYSTMINVYTKGGMYGEAMALYRELRQKELETDVVFYSALIDALCKNGLVESAMVMLDIMTRNGIRPNVVTYNSIIDAFGDVASLENGLETSSQGNEHQAETSSQGNEHQAESSSSMLIARPFQNQMGDNDHDRIMKMFELLAAVEKGHVKKDRKVKQENFSILSLLQKMHEMEIKPNVVTFSAILNACSRCNSFEGASKLLDELRLFDNQVYGVAHGLLMGHRETIWFQAQTLFDDLKRMDPSTASAFYNALTDMLWNFGQKRGAQLVVLEGKRRNVWNGDWSESCLDLHLMSCGAASAMVHAWLLNIRSVVFEGCELPRLMSILTGWGKHSKVVGDGTLKKAIEALLNGMGAPFKIAECNMGRFISPGYVVAAWLKKSTTLNLLVLHDLITAHSELLPPPPLAAAKAHIA